MPSPEHEALVMLFRNRPGLAGELLRGALAFDVPRKTHAVLSSETMRSVRPVEIAADAVVVFERRGEPKLGAIVEIQRAPPDRDKRRAWLAYVVLLQRELDCPCVLLVLALDDAVATSCASPIATGHPGFVLRPLVVGRDAIPAVTDLSTAIGDIELAVLSAVAHGRAIGRSMWRYPPCTRSTVSPTSTSSGGPSTLIWSWVRSLPQRGPCWRQS